jgi:peptide/nickel transport system permease protein
MSATEAVGELSGTDRATQGGLVASLVSRSRSQGRLAGCHSQALGIGAASVLVLITLFCFVGPLLYRTNQTGTNLLAVNLAPGAAHPLGTDDLGRDVLGRLMVGGQSSIEIGLAVAVLAVAAGTLCGSLAGWFGGVLDSLLMRLVDLLVALPPLFILIFIGSVRAPSAPELIWVIAALSWPTPARLVRAETLSLKHREFVEAVHAAGGSRTRVIVRHILPNTLGTMMVNVTFQVADAVLALATLSFLGLGLPPPAASWGDMLSKGVTFVFSGYWWEIYPAGVMIILTVLCFSLLGDALRERIDGRLRTR